MLHAVRMQRVKMLSALARMVTTAMDLFAPTSTSVTSLTFVETVWSVETLKVATLAKISTSVTQILVMRMQNVLIRSEVISASANRASTAMVSHVLTKMSVTQIRAIKMLPAKIQSVATLVHVTQALPLKESAVSTIMNVIRIRAIRMQSAQTYQEALNVNVMKDFSDLVSHAPISMSATQTHAIRTRPVTIC